MKGQQLAETLAKKLDTIIALLLASDIKGKTMEQKLELLTRFDFTNEEIAAILGTTKGTIGVMKTRLSKKRNVK